MRKSLTLILISTWLILAHSNCQEKKAVYNPKAIELNNKATKFIITGDYASALLCLDSAIHIDTTYYSAYANKCTVYCSLKDFKKALQESQMVTTMKPDLAEGWTFTGMLHDWLGDTANALKCYQKSIEIFDERISNPAKQKSLAANKLNRALALILMGQEEAGRSELIILRKAYPDDKTVDGLLTSTKKEYLEEQFGDR